MSFTILSESYGRRLPKITAEADSADDLTALGTDYAEGSTCEIGGKTYTLDKVQGWIEEGSGGGGSGGVLVVNAAYNEGDDNYTLDKTWQEIRDADFAVIIGLTRSVGNKNWVPVEAADELGLLIIAYDGAMGDQYEFTATSASGYPVGGFVE